MNGFSELVFWKLWAIGLIGVLAWVLMTWQDAKDDRLAGTLLKALRCHSRSVAIAVVAHLFACVALWEGLFMDADWATAMGHIPHKDVGGYLSVITSLGSGYVSQSIVLKAASIAGRFGPRPPEPPPPEPGA